MKTPAIALVLVWTASSTLAQSCFESEPLLAAGDGPLAVALGDLDGDGDHDLGVIDAAAYDLRLYWNGGDGTWQPGSPIATGLNPSHLDFVDVDGDGDADLVHSNSWGMNLVTVRLNLGAQTFGSPLTYGVSAYPEHFVPGDLDNDGDLDLAVACSGAGTGGTGAAMFLRNQGNGNFVFGQALVAGGRRVAIADFDVDGDRDIAVVRDGGTTFYVAVNQGPANFPGTPIPVTLATVPLDVVAGDFDGDGRPDMAIVQEGNRFSIVRSIPGGFAPYVEYPTALPTSRLTASDLDADGDLDLAVLGNATDVTIFQNAGNGTFTANGTHPIGNGVYGLDSADLDADGDQDLAFPVFYFDAVRVLRNCTSTGAPGCFGDGSATACPCANASPVGADAGCLHSLGSGGTLRASGTPSLAADSIVLRGASMPDAPVLYFQGTSTINGGLGAAFGDGLRCAGGSVARIGTAMNAGGASQYPGVGQPPVSVVGGVTVPGERHYQVWYRNAASFCTPATFNLTNSLRLTWHP